MKTFLKNTGVRTGILYALVLFIDVIDSTMLNVALPHIAEALNTEVLRLDWAIMGFVIASTIAIPVSAYLGQRFGTKRVFLFGQTLYTVASLLCAGCGSVNGLIFCRFVQGFATGLVIPVGMSLMLNAVSHAQRPAFMAQISLVVRVAPTLGPFLAAWCLKFSSWPMLFLIKLPLSFVVLGISLLWLHDDGERVKESFDWKGLLLSSSGIVSLLQGLKLIGKAQAPLGLSLLVAGIFLMWLFVRQEQRCASPILKLSVYRARSFRLGTSLHSLCYQSFMALYFTLSIYLQQILGLSLDTTAWILSMVTIGMLLMAPLMGRAYPAMGPRKMIMFGYGVMAIVTACLAAAPVGTAPALLMALTLLLGVGTSCVISTNSVYIFSDIEKPKMSTASACHTLTRQLGASCGVAIAASLITFTGSGLSGDPLPFRITIACLAALPILGFLGSMRIPEKTMLAADA